MPIWQEAGLGGVILFSPLAISCLPMSHVSAPLPPSGTVSPTATFASIVPNGSFRLNTKRVFLTYPQCPLSKETVRDVLLDRSHGTSQILGWIVCEELHQDGNKHLHAMLVFNTPFNCRNAAHYDIDGYHPNIGTVRRFKNALTYIRKDSNYIENEYFARETNEASSRQENWLAAVNANSHEEFLLQIRDNFPDKFILYNDKILAYADKYFSPPEEFYTSPYESESFILPDPITDWVTSEVLIC
jgi:hypothetical protein